MPSLDVSMTLLSPRESQLARLVAAGYANREIAAMLGIRRQTVKNHVAAIFRKLGVHNRVQVTLAVNTHVAPSVLAHSDFPTPTMTSSPPSS